LSELLLNCMDRGTSRLIADPYKLHAALMTAFPQGQGGGRILFRQEAPLPESLWIQVIVQSTTSPHWSPLLESHANVARARTKEVTPTFRKGQRLRFRLRANPTVTRNGNRFGLVGEPDQRAWLENRAAEFGFILDHYRVIDEGMISSYKRADDGEESKGWRRMSFRAVRYEGLLTVRDETRLHETVGKGIGPAKGFGCGLLSLARV